MNQYLDELPNSVDLDQDGDNEFVRVQEYESHGRKFNITSDGTYGLWHVKAKKGSLPDSLKGQYTTVELAMTAIDSYMGSYVPASPINPDAEYARKRVLTPKEPVKEA